jgi:predicted nucleotidyltransferase
MRLKPKERTAVREAVDAVFGPQTEIRVFGSRARDEAKGGDLDLFIEVEPGQATLAAEMALRERIEPALDNLKLDVILHERGASLSPIARIAVRDGVPL